MSIYSLNKETSLRKAPPKTSANPSPALKIDKSLVAFSAIMIICGLIFTYSSSAFDGLYYFKRQFLFDVIGVIFMAVLAQYYSRLQKVIKPIWILFIVWGFLIWALLLPQAANVNRWINLGPINVQPSEIAKLALIIYLAAFLSKRPSMPPSTKTFIVPLIYAVVTIGLVALGKDIGIPALMFTVTMMIFFITGMRLWAIAAIIAAALPFLIAFIITQPYRMQRLTTFMNPEEVMAKGGYQLAHSFYAIGSGGWFGKGFGASDLKLEYLPAAHTDFIFAIICEEAGMLGAFFVIGAFAWLLFKGITLARTAKNPFNSYLLAGLTLALCLQAFINMGVAIGLLPTKGLPLPFFSYGGSSVIITLAMMGIIMNLSAVEKQKVNS